MKAFVITCASAALLLQSCGSIVNGSSQKVAITSSPSDAQIYINDKPMGRTPACVKLKRKDNHFVRLELPGYEPYECMLKRELSGWAFGNVVFGGLVGIAVDAMTGGMYKLSDDTVHGRIGQVATAKVTIPEGTIYVVNQPDPNWEKIGQLETVE